MTAVTTGISHRWVTSSVCLGGKDHVDTPPLHLCPARFHSALECASKSCYMFSEGICSVHDTAVSPQQSGTALTTHAVGLAGCPLDLLAW